METYRREPDSAAWLFFVRITFVLAVLAMALGIYHLPVSPWVQGFMGMAALFLTGSSIILSKTLRDQHEATKLVKRIDDLETERILREHAGNLVEARNGR